MIAPSFTIVQTESLQLECSEPLAGMYTLSPFVWREDQTYKLLVRAVPHSDAPSEKIARVYYGESEDGIRFKMRAEPAIAPGPSEDDRDGCEDPTITRVGTTYHIYYTGWNQAAKRGQLMLASGPDPRCPEKRGVALPSTHMRANPKEATIAKAADGTWRLFFEYAADGASKIGIARADAVDGPWSVLDSPFERRSGTWDSWHLSTGPVLIADRRHPVMFYNGATRQTAWRIGWVVFDENFTNVVARSDQPLIAPPPPQPGDTDIAFAASAVETGGAISLYYSVADKDMVRATLRVEKPPV